MTSGANNVEAWMARQRMRELRFDEVLRWSLRDIRARRWTLTPIKAAHIKKLQAMGLIQFLNDEPVVKCRAECRRMSPWSFKEQRLFMQIAASTKSFDELVKRTGRQLRQVRAAARRLGVTLAKQIASDNQLALAGC